MNESVYERIGEASGYLKLDLKATDVAELAARENWTEEHLKYVADMFFFMKSQEEEKTVQTLLRLSRLPLKEPKTFQNFDFSQIHGREAEMLQNLSTLAALYGRRNLAFIGPQGVGKTHLAMAFGRACCEKGYKAYFLKASELNQKLTDAIKYGHENSTINGLVKPSCLIIDEIGRCEFNKTNTRMFFDVIDRRYNKEGPNTLILTSNLQPSRWGEFFGENSSLLCSMDRIFDMATVFNIKGQSYQGKQLQTVTLAAGQPSSLPTASR